MVVQHNLTAMNANRMLGLTTSAQAKSTEKLSSGYKINRAADDAAGLSISEKMRKQIRGLTQASANAQDGISAVQTAEGALTEVHDMLQRMNELAVKAANGTMSESDRQTIQDEIDQLVTEVDRVAETTKFNETYLLKGAEDGSTVESTTYEYAYKQAAGGLSVNQDAFNTYSVSRVNEPTTAISVKQTAYAVNTAEKQSLTLSSTSTSIEDDIAACLELDEDGNITVKEGWVLYSVAPTTTTEFGTQVNSDKQISSADLGTYFETTTTNAIYTDKDNKTLATEEDIQNAFNNGSYTGVLYAENNAGVVTEIGAEDNYLSTFFTITKDEVYGVTADGEQIALSTATDDDLAKLYKEDGTLQDGVQLYSVAEDTTGEFGAQVTGKNVSKDAADYVKVGSNELLDADGNAVSAEELAAYFEDGVYQGGLYKINADGEQTEVGREQIADYVTTTSTQTTSRAALELDLHVGADSADTNKIKLTIESMDATTLGIKINGEALSVKTKEDATANIDVIADAISKVSAQRSTLGAVQNRLEHTINNLDNVVENTTSAESQIRDTDMATEMVSYSNNNILAQAGQAMLAQANQANQGVLSLLG